jgi:hypothetical protein
MLMLNAIMLNVLYTKSHHYVYYHKSTSLSKYTKWCYAECHNAECRGALTTSAWETPYVLTETVTPHVINLYLHFL